MALPSSGALTLSDIQTEFNGSNPIQLNEYYAGGSYVAAGTVGTYGSVPSSGAIGIRNFYGTTNIRPFSYNFSGLAGTTNTTPFGNSFASALNSTGKLYTTGIYYSNPLSLRGRISTMVSGTGTSIDIKIGRQLRGSCGIDSSDSFYNLYENGTVAITKYNSSGTHVWSYLTSNVYGFSSSQYGKKLSISSSGNMYIGGHDSGVTRGYITKITSTTSPVIAWTRSILTGSNPNYSVSALGTDSSDNVYATGYGSNTSTGAGMGFLIKYNTSGTIQWQRKISVGTQVVYINDLYTNNSTADTFLCGRHPSSGGVLIMKYNSSGVIQWQKTNDTIYGNGYGIAQTSAGNIYVVGSDDIRTTDLSVIKLDSTGAVIWQRKIALSAFSVVLNSASIIVDSSETYLYITAGVTQTKLSGGTSDDIGMVLKLKTDGTGTGTFTNNLVSGRTGEYTYSATTRTFSNGTVTDAAGSFTLASVTTTISSDILNGAYSTSVPVSTEVFTNSVVTVV